MGRTYARILKNIHGGDSKTTTTTTVAIGVKTWAAAQ
jgi:hypothetical protein